MCAYHLLQLSSTAMLRLPFTLQVPAARSVLHARVSFHILIFGACARKAIVSACVRPRKLRCYRERTLVLGGI